MTQRGGEAGADWFVDQSLAQLRLTLSGRADHAAATTVCGIGAQGQAAPDWRWRAAASSIAIATYALPGLAPFSRQVRARIARVAAPEVVTRRIHAQNVGTADPGWHARTHPAPALCPVWILDRAQAASVAARPVIVGIRIDIYAPPVAHLGVDNGRFSARTILRIPA